MGTTPPPSLLYHIPNRPSAPHHHPRTQIAMAMARSPSSSLCHPCRDTSPSSTSTPRTALLPSPCLAPSTHGPLISAPNSLLTHDIVLGFEAHFVVLLDSPEMPPHVDERERLREAKVWFRGEVQQPESISFDPQHRGPYTTIVNGRSYSRTVSGGSPSWRTPRTGRWSSIAGPRPHRRSTSLMSTSTAPCLRSTSIRRSPVYRHTSTCSRLAPKAGWPRCSPCASTSPTTSTLMTMGTSNSPTLASTTRDSVIPCPPSLSSALRAWLDVHLFPTNRAVGDREHHDLEIGLEFGRSSLVSFTLFTFTPN
jgi:hypothetical protein